MESNFGQKNKTKIQKKTKKQKKETVISFYLTKEKKRESSGLRLLLVLDSKNSAPKEHRESTNHCPSTKRPSDEYYFGDKPSREEMLGTGARVLVNH